jgi:hypothetical protein
MVLIAAMMVIACNKKTEVAGEAAGQLCYIYVENKDTVKMTITIQDKTLIGELRYKLFEKDRNYGQLQGVISGDTIIANYEFESEGKKSIREVAFLRTENTLIEGFGPMDTTGTRFSSHRVLTFTGFELHKTDCRE